MLLYGASLALNHLQATNQSNVINLFDYIDFPTEDQSSVFKKIHLHVFHGDSMFSKFAFKIGNYDNMTIPENANTTSAYALKMALESKRSSAKDLLFQFNKETARKN